MKKILIINLLSFIFTLSLTAQQSAPQDWFLLDAKQNKFPGVSAEKAYSELLKNKTAKTITVAVIDGGTEEAHEDLKAVLWNNPGEVAANGIDDDRNGYIDDVHGWNFIGGKDSNVAEDTYEVTRVYFALKDKYGNMSAGDVPPAQKKEYETYLYAREVYTKKYEESFKMTTLMGGLAKVSEKIIKEAGTDNPTPAQVSSFQPANVEEVIAKQSIESLVQKGIPLSAFINEITPALEHYSKERDFFLNPGFDPRSRVGDNYADPTERFYGNNRVGAPNGEHGTHVAGIIAAARNNGVGMNGVADHVRIMILRVVPDGDERDKDVANAIRYAADNGAAIINMSFGKSFSPYKKAVDDAVRYAVSKDVLLIHAAGNDGENIDVEKNFPKAFYDDGGKAETWIEVGASSWKGGKNMAADFSNYGKTSVDLFAPGVDIFSTIPESKYATYDGTSMAAPVTSGVAAIIRAYYPQLTALQVKEILLKSVVPVKGKVLVPSEEKKKVKMTELCVTGGIVNAYNAVKLAEKQYVKK